MKKRTIVILCIVAVMLVLVPAGIAVNFLLMPSSKDVLFVLSQAYLYDRDGWKAATLEPQKKVIAASRPEEGLVLQGYGYSVVVSVYDKVEQKIENNEYFSDYSLSDTKAIVLHNKVDNVFQADISADVREQFETAVGKPITSEYEFHEAIYSISVEDFSLFDDDKNQAVALRLAAKSGSLGQSIVSISCYKNDLVKGLTIRSDRATKVEFCSVNDPNTVYAIVILGDFTQEEVDAIIGSIAFDKTEE